MAAGAGDGTAGDAAAGVAEFEANGEGVGGSVGNVGTVCATLVGLGSNAVLRLFSPFSLIVGGLPSSVGMGTAPLESLTAAGVGGIEALGEGEAMGLGVGLTLLRVLKSSSTNSLETRLGAFGSSLLPVSVTLLALLWVSEGVLLPTKRLRPTILARLDG